MSLGLKENIQAVEVGLPLEAMQQTASVQYGPHRRAEAASWVYGCAACLLAVGWFVLFHPYWAPAHDGVDQNGYAVGGRMFADHASTGMMPPDLFGYVSANWIGTPWLTYYPKYPLGLPMMFAALLKLGETSVGRAIVFASESPLWCFLPVLAFIALRSVWRWRFGQSRWVGTPICLAVTFAVTLLAIRIAAGPLAKLPIHGPTVGVELCYLLCPMATLLALIATFELVRLVAPPFVAILAMIAMGCNPITLELAFDSNSHASTLCFVAWGMFLLIRWWQVGGVSRAIVAGFLLGYAVTIRYTEGMLLLPVLLAIVLRQPWRNRRALIESALLLAWWAIPVLFLASFNLGAFGALTGYDSTNESTGFSLMNFQINWETTVRELYGIGLFFILPCALVGLAVLFMQRWKLALLLTSWIVPNLVLYTAYYWAPDTANSAYMRFYLTIFPAMLMPAFWLLGSLAPMAMRAMSRHPTTPKWSIVAGAAAFALLSGFALSYTYGDQLWQSAHPAPPVATPLSQRDMRLLRLRGGPAMGAINRRDEEQRRKAESEEDRVRLRAGSVYAAEHLPAWAGAAAVALAIGYGLIWLAAGKSAWVWGASPMAGVVVLGAGLLALSSAAMGVYQVEPDMDMIYNRHLGQDMAAESLVDQVGAPAGSVIFGDASVLNHLQFVGDYQVYNPAQFSMTFVNSLSPDRRNDPDEPNPMQPERVDMLYRLLWRYTEPRMLAEQSKIAHRALDAGRHVYVVTPAAREATFRNWYFPSTKFRTVERATWDVLPLLQPRHPREQRAAGFGVGGMRRFGPPPGAPGQAMEGQKWVILEVLPLPART